MITRGYLFVYHVHEHHEYLGEVLQDQVRRRLDCERAPFERIEAVEDEGRDSGVFDEQAGTDDPQNRESDTTCARAARFELAAACEVEEYLEGRDEEHRVQEAEDPGGDLVGEDRDVVARPLLADSDVAVEHEEGLAVDHHDHEEVEGETLQVQVRAGQDLPELGQKEVRGYIAGAAGCTPRSCSSKRKEPPC